MAKLQLKLKIWRQSSSSDDGKFEMYNVDNLNTHMSFLEMLDVLNENSQKIGSPLLLIMTAERICGICSMVINGRPHGPMKDPTTCQLHEAL